jgi:cyanophycinase-like exopeptidase
MENDRIVPPERIAGKGWLALIGGGELTFGETEVADRLWLSKLDAGAKVGFLPAASGSTEYGGHFADYLREAFGRQVEAIPIYRSRDARRAKNLGRVAACDALYLGGGVVDQLLDAVRDTPAAEALAEKLRGGGVVTAIAASAQALGQVAPSLLRHELVDALAWLPGGAVATNFDPRDERPLRRLLEHPVVRWGLGIPSGAAVLLGPGGEVEIVGEAFVAEGDGEIRKL